MSVQVSYKKQTIFGIMLLLILLGAVEGSARVYEFNEPPNCVLLNSDSYKDVDPFLARQICLDMSQVMYEEKGILQLKSNQHFPTININSQGFRGPETTIEKPENVLRIFMVGGSTTFGAGSTSDNTTIPSILQIKLQESNPTKKIEIINAGIPFADSFREVYHIKNKIIEYSPDVIIIYDGWNDAFHKRIYDESIQKIENQEDNEIKFKKFPFYRTPFVINKILGETSNEHSNIEKGSNEEVISNWKNNLLDLCKIGNQKGFKTFIVVQPLVGTGNKNLSPYELKYLNSSKSDILEIIHGFTTELKILETTCSGTADFTNVLDGISEPIFYDQGHMNDQGNEIIAEDLFNLINPILK
jgi:hypothetical protein